MDNKLIKDKRGILEIQPVVLGLVLIGILLGVGFVILAKFSASLDAGSAAKNAVDQTSTQLATIPSTWLPVLVVVIIAAVVLFYVIRSFGGGRKTR